jgi:hypothetical protein
LLTGEQAITEFDRCSATELLKLAFQAGFEPATHGSEVSVTYTTGQGGCAKTRRGMSDESSESLLCSAFLLQDYAPAPQGEHSGRVSRPASC